MTYRSEQHAPAAWWRTCVLCAGAVVVSGLGTPTSAAAYCAYITHDDVVSVIDTASNTVAATIPVGAQPVGVAATPDGHFVYVANCGASCLDGAPAEDSISVIDTATNTVAATVHGGVGPFSVAFTPDGASAYVSNCGTWCANGKPRSGFSVSVIDTAKALADPAHAVAATISNVDSGVIAITPRDTFAGGIFAYVANWDPDTVSVIDTATNTVHTTIPIGRGGVSGGIAITPDGHWAYVPAGGDEQVPGSVIDMRTNTVVATIPGMKGGFVTVSPDGARAYAVAGGGDLPASLAVIDTRSNRVTSTIAGVSGFFPAVTPDGAFVYVPSHQDSSVAVINTVTGALSTLPLGGGSWGGIAIASVPGGCGGTGVPCTGDCDGGGAVTVNEIVKLVNIALGVQHVSDCPKGLLATVTDADVTVLVIIRAVNNALNSCTG